MQVADFGQSHQLEPSQVSVEINTYGALTHMAPEVLSQNQMGKAADVYSWGVLLWQVRREETTRGGCCCAAGDDAWGVLLWQGRREVTTRGGGKEVGCMSFPREHATQMTMTMMR